MVWSYPFSIEMPYQILRWNSLLKRTGNPNIGVFFSHVDYTLQKPDYHNLANLQMAYIFNAAVKGIWFAKTKSKITWYIVLEKYVHTIDLDYC